VCADEDFLQQDDVHGEDDVAPEDFEGDDDSTEADVLHA
jgi:hypothetical protein